MGWGWGDFKRRKNIERKRIKKCIILRKMVIVSVETFSEALRLL